jgi:hypothetical protein
MKRTALALALWLAAILFLTNAARAGEGDAAAPAPSGHGPGCSCGEGTTVNPASIDPIYHTHAAGMWMASYQFMHTGMEGLRDGTADVPADRVTPMGSAPYGYMMAPTEMTMDMHMLMLMYGVTDRLTLMGMANYQVNRMDMVMNMGMGNRPMDTMRTSGPGDVELRGLWNAGAGLVAGLGVSLPTGSTGEQFETMGTTYRAPYDMQLGSGSVDLRPSLTWSGASRDGLWGFGGQAVYTWHPGNNKDGYHLGDSLKATGWLERALGPVRASARLSYSNTGRIHGEDPEIAKLLDMSTGAPTPDADPANYGGQRVDGLLGASVGVGAWRFGIEGGVPLYQNLNGLQLKTGWMLSAALQVMM